MEDELTLQDILVTSEPEREVEIRVGERSFRVVVRRLSFLEKTACISAATEYALDEQGNLKTSFHLDRYYREALRRAIVKAPWPITAAVLDKVRPEVGEQLIALVPPPFGSEAENFTDGSATSSKGGRKTR